MRLVLTECQYNLTYTKATHVNKLDYGFVYNGWRKFDMITTQGVNIF